jgi:hypothetical protein
VKSKTEKVLKEIEQDFKKTFPGFSYSIEYLNPTGDYIFMADKRISDTKKFLRWVGKMNDKLFKEDVNNIRIIEEI